VQLDASYPLLRFHMKKLILLFVMFMPMLELKAQTRPSISVVGEAKMSVAPDQVVFSLEVVTANKDLSVAKRENDSRASRALEAARQLQVASADIQTGSLTISPQYTGEKDVRGRGVLIGYEVTKRIYVTLKALEKIDQFLSQIISAGVNKVVSIDIQNSKLQTYQEQVRAMAIKNAQAKALAYAAQLGQTIGKAYVIREEQADHPSMQAFAGDGSGSGDGTAWGDTSGKIETPTNPYASPVTFALGEIDVEEKVYVIFELR
jgi:uncharacterized protein